MNDLILGEKMPKNKTTIENHVLAHTHVHYSCTTVYIQRKYI